MWMSSARRAGAGRRFVVSVLVAASVVAVGQVVAASGARAATTYFVSATGSDTNPGTAAAPFRNIQRCAVLMQPGDTCTVGSGVYRETVRPVRSGSAAAPITYRAAPNALVAVSGAEVVTGWRAVTSADLSALVARDPTLAQSELALTGVPRGEVYVVDQSLPEATNQQLFFGGRMVVEGQYPHAGTDPLAPPIRFAAAGTTDTHVVDPLLDKPAGYWNGARVHVNRWYAPYSGTVTNYRPGSFDLAGMAATCVPPTPYSTRYYLFGKLQAMSQRNTWFYDHAARKLYFWTPDGLNPEGRNVEVKRRDLAFDLTASSHTVITGLTFFGSTIRTGNSSTGVVLDTVNGRYLSHRTEVVADPPLPATSCTTWTSGESTTGIVLRGTGNTLRNSELSLSSGNGVVVLGSGNTVTRNFIHDVDYLGTYAAGVNVGGPNRIVNNTIRRTGRSGVNVGTHLVGRRLSGMEVGYNDVSDYDRLSADSGAIYACCEIDMSGSSFHHNWVYDENAMERGRGEAGIFLDNSMLNVLVHNNVGWDNTSLTVFVNGNNKASPGHAIYNNNGGVRLLNIREAPATATRTRIVNTIGRIRSDGVAVPGQIDFATNLDGDPLYRNEAARDFRLQAASPARNTGTFLTWITVGFTDPNPSRGAYQYDAPRWVPGR
jgi:hypothetical protein